MKNLTRFLLLLAALTGASAFGQVVNSCNYGPCPPITASGGTLIVANVFGGMSATFEEIVSGTPATVSITVQGCMRGGTCDTAMDTNTLVGSTNRSIVPTIKPYSYFLVTATWTGGTNPTVQINPFITTAKGGRVTVQPCTPTSQKSETAADTNVLTCAIPAQVGSYRIRVVLSLSAANAATVGWTATWTDSNGNAQTPTNLSLVQSGVAAPALTFTTSVAGNYYGEANVDVNNAGTSIVVKLTFSGTSFTGKVSADVERLI